MPPSYRSRNANTNTITSISRPPTTTPGNDSMESLDRNNALSNNSSNQNTLSSSNNGNVPQNIATTATLIDQLQNTVSLIPETTSSIQVNFPSSTSATMATSTTTITTSTTPSITKESVHTIAIEAAGATRPNEQQHFSSNQSQNLNEKLNPRVTNSNNNNINYNNIRTSNSVSSSSSSSVSCTKTSGSPSKSMASTILTTMASTGAKAMTSRNEQSSAPTSSRKELVTIVTISASQEPETSPSEMEILAHL